MAHVICVYCDSPLPAAQTPAEGGAVKCPACRRPNEVLSLFPALLKTWHVSPPALPADPPGEGEAACFYSPNRRATAMCDHCGVLISDVWTAAWGSKTLCLKCLEHLREEGKDPGFQSSRILWDNLALFLACLPFTIIIWPVMIVTAPASIFLSLWHWNSPRSMIPRGRWRLGFALLLALAQLGFLVLVVLQIWFNIFKTR